MLGAIIGDIVSSRYEFANTHTTDFELFTPYNNFTDDTICTIAVADAILQNKSFKDSLLYWYRKYPSPMGAYGGRFGQWVRSANPTTLSIAFFKKGITIIFFCPFVFYCQF